MSAIKKASPSHESAHLHVSGEAVYVDDIIELSGTLFAALGLSQRPHAKIKNMDLSAVTAAAGVVAVLTADDIKGKNDCGPIVEDDPILADGLVQFVGQPMFVVVADSYSKARRAAALAKVEYQDLPAIMTPQEAKLKASLVIPPMQLVRGSAAEKLANSLHRSKGTFYVGGQEQFYLEGQISYAIPKEDNGLLVYCSTQHPSEMQHLVAHAIERDFNQIIVETRRMGGGFGGKESQSALFACVASICADHLACPVKLRLDRDDDFLATGKRHCCYYEYEVGYDDAGVITAVKVEMTLRAGFSTDLSPPVATRAICHFDNAYYLSDVEIHALCGKTNTQSNTAFRGFGGPQGAIAIENIIDNIARDLNKDSLDIRKVNFYGKTERNVTPYGQQITDNIIHELVDELVESSDYRARRDEIMAYNQSSLILKKGIALTPVKFGISFNMVHFNQAGALVHIYTDGSILVNHGGTEMGQGLNTKVAQVVAKVFGVDLARVRSTATDTSKVANTSATAASSGTDLNGKAAEDAALNIKQRLAEFMLQRNSEKRAKSEQSDDTPKGDVFIQERKKYRKRGGDVISDVVFENDRVRLGNQTVSFNELIIEAYQKRIQLWSDGFYKTPKLHWDKDKLQGRPFYYFAYGAAVSEVIIDTLTGEMKLLRADLLHDVGDSINTGIDIGQIEGGFIQGVGWLSCEELCWNPQGKLTTHAPSTYKIPAVNDCPDDLRVSLFKNSNREDTIHRSKAVGEPPLLLGFSTFFAIKDAIASTADYTINPQLNAPATPESILNAITGLKS